MSANTPSIKVALSVDFLSAFSEIPRKMQGKVRDFIEKFKANPTASGINYEKINNAKDSNLRSVRIDQTYRGIVLKPETGNVYALLWVAHHDDAYAWAQKRRCDIHPETGALQVLSVQEMTMTVPAAPAPEPTAIETTVPASGLFDAVPDAELFRLGLPHPLLEAVRAVLDEPGLDALQPQLPDEAYEALFLLAAGYTPDEVLELISGDARAPKETVDTTDFAKALENPQTLRRFFVVEDDLALAAVLNAPLEKWRVFLHPSQRKLVERKASGPVRVLGGAGTGKTVVGMHRARHLAEHVFTAPTDRILVTTYTRNLATDIRSNLAKICSKDAFARLEVLNLDQWVVNFLKQQGFPYRIAYENEAERKRAWQSAMSLAPVTLGLAPGFYREELEKVVLPQGITDQAEYFKASRLGRGTSLGRKERAAIWPVFAEYRRLLREKQLIETQDAMREARMMLEQKGDILPYKSVVVDEAQDMGPQAFQLIRQLVPGGDRANDLFIVGDAHQRIYGQQVVLSRCGINVRGRSTTLKINYRTTDEIRQWSVRLLAGQPIDNLDGEADDSRGYKSLMHGEFPEIKHFKGINDEVDFFVDRLKELGQETGGLGAVCLVARTKPILQDYERLLAAKGIPTVTLDKDGDSLESGLRLATIHRVKGLEFNHMFIAGANEGVIPLTFVVDDASDDTTRQERELAERSLLYVAATRAKRHVLVTSHGKPSPFLAGAT